MITIEEAREIDPSLDDLTDAELGRVLEILYNLANLSLKLWLEKDLSGSKVPTGCLEEGEEVR